MCTCMRGDSVISLHPPLPPSFSQGGPVSWVSYENGETMSFGTPFDEAELLAALAAATA